MQETTMSLMDAIKTRRSVRGYLDKEVEPEIMEAIFASAQLAPSNCNVQPWKVFVASGDAKDLIRDMLVEEVTNGRTETPDYPGNPKFVGEYRKRQVDCAFELYDNMDIARDDKEGRFRALLRNFQLFDAPHIAFIGMHKDFSVSVALDVGMYAQTLMLAMTSYGVSSCAMGSMRQFPSIPKKVFSIDPDINILFGISFGYEDESVAANKTRVSRDDVAASVVFKS